MAMEVRYGESSMKRLAVCLVFAAVILAPAMSTARSGWLQNPLRETSGRAIGDSLVSSR
jgi:hypothetical protein